MSVRKNRDAIKKSCSAHCGERAARMGKARTPIMQRMEND
jgi:hypothetical protein